MIAKTVSGAVALTTALLIAAVPAQAQHWGHRHGHWGGGYHHRHGGAGVAAGIAGFAAGALIGGAIASQPRYAPGYAPAPVYGGNADAIAYCQSRFRSYDPASGTYLGYDGRRHACP